MTGTKAAAAALVVTQVVHALVPADTEAEGYMGLVGGLILLIASLAALYGLMQGLDWARSVLGWAGLGVSVGFVAYHAVPWSSPVTNPYIGEPVGVPAWISVVFAVAAGVWAAYEGFDYLRQPST